MGDADESAQDEEIDRLLLSSLRYWEVEHDLIEERIEQIGSRAGEISEKWDGSGVIFWSST